MSSCPASKREAEQLTWKAFHGVSQSARAASFGSGRLGEALNMLPSLRGCALGGTRPKPIAPSLVGACREKKDRWFRTAYQWFGQGQRSPI